MNQDRRKTDKWSISKQINIPDVLTIAVFLVSVVSLYFQLDGRITLLEKQQINTAEKLAEIRSLVERIDNKIDGAILREIDRSKR